MKKSVSIILFAVVSLSAFSQNPIVSHCFTADPAPMVFEGNDSLYVYCDEDMNVPGVNDFYYMERWRVYSTVDMVNWTDHGNAMPRTNFSWAREGTCWASQCVKKGDYYYWYMCASKPNDWRHYIGVGRSKKPSGPFTDPRGTHIISTGDGGDIDPTVFVDDDGKAYIYWGNNKLYYATLTSNMLGAGGSVKVALTEEAFGGKKVTNSEGKEVVQGKDCYEEGPWLDKRGDNYYLIYAAGGVPEHISYSMSKSPKGPWTYKGYVMNNQDTGSFTNHSGIVNYKGKDYFFYHTAWAKNGGGFNRSMAVEEMHFNEDGTIQPVKATKTGVGPLCTLSPFVRQQAETINKAEGVSVVGNENTGVYVTGIHSSDYIKVRNVDFGSESPTSITVRVACKLPKYCYLVVRKGTATGSIIARCKIESTGGDKIWSEITCDLSSKITGVTDLYFTFAGTVPDGDSTLFNFDWWKFNTAEETAINELNMTDMEKDKSIYDLTGRRVLVPQKGIYVIGGKKVAQF